MSGTRKMSKFELDEFVRSRLEAAHTDASEGRPVEGQEWIPPQVAESSGAVVAGKARAPGEAGEPGEARQASDPNHAHDRPTLNLTDEPREAGVAREEGSWGAFENVDLPSPVFTPIQGDSSADLTANSRPANDAVAIDPHAKETTRARRFSSPPYETPPYEAAVNPPAVRVRRSTAPPSESAQHHPPVRPPAASHPSFGPEDRPSVEIDPDANTPMNVEALRTQLARKFASLADKVTEAFTDFTIGAGAWTVELTAPAGMSTGGGKQALQHLMLRPKRQGYQVLVGGLVNGVHRRAELRDYDHIAMVYEVRFRARLQITASEWEQFLRKAEVVLNGAGIQSQRVPPTKDLIAHSKRSPRVSKVAIAAFVIVAVLALIVGWRVLVALGVLRIA